MRTSTIILAIGSLFVAQLAGASPSSDGAQIIDGHLHLLSKRGSSHGSAGLPNTRRHHARNGGALKQKKKKRGSSSGYCKKKGSSATSSSSSSAAPASGTVTKAAQEDTYSSSSSSSSAWSSKATSSASASASASASSSGSSSDSSSSDSDVSSIAASTLGSISAFAGINEGIGSWFRTDASSDSTNGQSWCQTYYKDSWMGFAPSVGTMLNNFGGDMTKAAKAYCGREVKFTNPNNGNTAIGFIADGFDDKWVRTPGSVDLTVALFTSLYGKSTSNKNDVIQNLQWEFTGNVVEEGTFQHGKYSRE